MNGFVLKAKGGILYDENVGGDLKHVCIFRLKFISLFGLQLIANIILLSFYYLTKG